MERLTVENGALTVGSLFSGIGAFDLAFERSGFAPLWQCEIDKNCLKLLASKWPAVPRHDDVTTFDPSQHPCPTVIVFGSPCQDLSVAGKRAGMAGERSGLFFYATRIIKHFVGRGLEFAVWENVPGCLSSLGGRDFAAVIAAMGQCGALDVAWRILDAQWFNLPQRRRRVFLVADFRGQRAEKILALSESLQGYPAPRREKGQSVAPPIAGCSNGGGANGPGRTADDAEALIPLTANPIGSHRQRQDLDHDTYVSVSHPLLGKANSSHDDSAETYVLAHGQGNAEHVKDGDPSLTCNHEAPIAIRTSGNCGPFVQGDKTGALNCATDPNQNIVMLPVPFDTTQITSKANYSNPQPGDPAHPLASSGHAPALAFQSRIARNGRGQPEEICPALNGTDAGETSDMRPLVATQYQVRRLTPGECEKLMGLPPGWTKYFQTGGQSDIICPCNIFADLKVVAGRSLIVNVESVSCTIRDSNASEATIFLQSQIKPFTNARCVQGRLETAELEDCARDIINHGNVTEMHFNQTGIWLNKAKSDAEGREFISQSLRLRLVESYSEENLSTILTWMSAMIALKISTFAQTEQNICKCMIHWSEPGLNLSIGPEELSLKVAGIGLFSDSTRYRMLGNSLAVPVAEWIAKRMAKTL